MMMLIDVCHSNHQNRISYITTIKGKIIVFINFPASNDKIWKNIDNKLVKLVPNNCNKKVMNTLSTLEISQQFDIVKKEAK